MRDRSNRTWGTASGNSRLHDSTSSTNLTVAARLQTYIDQEQQLAGSQSSSSTQLGKSWHDNRMLANAVSRDHRMRLQWRKAIKREEDAERRDVEQRLSNFEENFRKLRIDPSKTLYADEEPEDDDEGSTNQQAEGSVPSRTV